MKQLWVLRLLGTPQLRRAGDDEELSLERKASALLAYLTLQGPSSRSTLAGLLWPNVLETRARNNLRQLLHRLRNYEGLIATDGDLRLGTVDVDARDLVALAAAGDQTQVVERWGDHRSLLLEGHDYDDCPDLAEWLMAERERLTGLIREALESEAERREAVGEIRSAVVCAQQLSALDPLSEAGYRRLMRLHYLAGDRGQAMAAFRRCRQVLRETFGLEPLPDTVELARAIDSGVAPKAEASSSRALPVTLLRPPSLIGREAAWAELEAAWGRVQTILVSGEAGIGKSRLMREYASSKGPALVTRGMPGDRDVPYASKARALSEILHAHPEYAEEPWVRDELARILPELFTAPPGQAPITEQPQKLRLFEAAATVLARALAGSAVLINDDMHLWDEASFEMGAYFVSRFDGFPAHALSSFRRGELSPERERALWGFVDSGVAAILELQPLDSDAIARLMADAEVGDQAPSAADLERLSGGNPFYVLEVLRNLWQDGASAGVERGDPLPASAAAVLTRRIQRLSSAAADLLRVRAMAAGTFSTELAAAVLEVPVATVRSAVDELERHRLLEHGELGHELLGDAIERYTPPEARRLWHGRLASKLELFGAPPAAVATHYLAAWDGNAAFPHLLAAGAAARDVFALEEAARWFQRALWAAPDDHGRAEALLRLDDVTAQSGRRDEAGALLDALDALASDLQDATLLLELALRRARWWTLGGDRERATRLAVEALADAERLGDADRVDRARLTLGDLSYLAGDYAAAQEHFTHVTASAQDARRLRAFQRLGALQALRGDVDVAFEHHRQALLLARRARDLPLVATLLNSLGADRERRGAYQEAAGYFQEAEAVASRSADRRTAAIALSNAALTAINRGALAEGLRFAGRALEAAAPLGIDRALAMASFTHGYALRRLGYFDEARTALEEAARLREAGGDVRGSLVARFNLAAIDLESAAPTVAARERIDAVLTELEALNLPQFSAWCHLELAFIGSRPGEAARHVERALALDDSQHLRFAAAVAALSVAVDDGDEPTVRTAWSRLAELIDGDTVMETSQALLLLARTTEDATTCADLLARAQARLAEEVAGLPDDATERRTAYLERRLPVHD